MAKLIAFFADMDLESGIGHVMRCKAIADSIKDLELESILILNSIDNILINKFEINKSFKKIYNVNFVKNLDHINTILVVDTYKLSINDAIFNHNWKKTLGVFDEDTPRYKVDIILAQNLSKNLVLNRDQIRYDQLIVDDYFLKSRNLAKRYTNKTKRKIVIVGGGTDPSGFVKAVCRQLTQISGKYSYFVFSDEIFEYRDSRFIFIKPGPLLRDYLLECDTVFSTAGSTVWEILTLQICLAVGLATQNQASNYEILANNELAIPLGEFSENEWKIDFLKCEQILKNSQTRETLYHNMQSRFKPKSSKEIFLNIRLD